ncbi:MAG: U32 family peptidase, partial [Ruminococcaceae bacterium]|nr:U32 family peptidase [Oscillospiraceae bacterium]
TNAYRIAMDQYMKDPANYRFDRRLLHELDCVSHREYCTGFYYDDPLNEANTCTVPGYLKEKAYFAIAESYDEESGTACFLQRNKLSVGDKAELMSPGSVGIPFTVDNMKNEAGEDISSAPHPSMRFYIKTSFPVKEGDILREG